MTMKSQSGFAQILLVGILLLGLAAALYLVQKTNILKSRAGSNPIIFVNADNTKCDPSSSSCSSSTSQVKVELRSTLGPPISDNPSSSSQLTMQGLQQAFGSIRGDSKYDSKYDVNNDGKINLTDFNTLKRNGSLSTASPSATVTNTASTTSYKIAESPTDLDTTSYLLYTTEPVVVNYTFKNTTPGQKFIWVEFKDNTSKTERKSAQITFQAPPTTTPTHTPTSIPPTARPTPTISYSSKTINLTPGALIYASGTITAQYSNTTDNQGYTTFIMQGQLNNMTKNIKYTVALCPTSGQCEHKDLNQVNSNTVFINNLTMKAIHSQTNPIAFIKIVSNPTASYSPCISVLNPCLIGNFGNVTTSPTPTPSLVRDVSLYRSVRNAGVNYLPNASGQVSVNLTSYNINTNVAYLSFNGSVSGLEPNQNYQVWTCWPNGLDCGSNGVTAAFTTNNSGSANFSGLTLNQENGSGNRRIYYVKVVQVLSGGPIPAQSCGAVGDACLTGYYGVPGH